MGAVTLFLGACSAAADPVPDTGADPITVTSTANAPEDVPLAQDHAQKGPSGQPCEVTGHTAEAEDDGYWKLELGEIDVDISSDGMILEIDR